MRGVAQRGRDAEVVLARELEGDGWLVGSRRHIGGAGDLLAVRDRVWLIEVKSTARSPWHAFPPADRRALLEAAARIGAVPWLAWRPPGVRVWTWLGRGDWPD
jgi:Holliday junction resolvase